MKEKGLWYSNACPVRVKVLDTHNGQHKIRYRKHYRHGGFCGSYLTDVWVKTETVLVGITDEAIGNQIYAIKQELIKLNRGGK